MNDPFADDQPQPKTISTISILMRSRFVASFVLFAIVVAMFVGTPILFSWILRVFYENSYAAQLQWLVQALITGGFTALLTILWLWLRSHVGWLWARVILSWLCIHMMSCFFLLLSNIAASKMPSIREVVSMGIMPYLLYLTSGFFLGWLIQVARVKVPWNDGANRSQFGIADLFGLMLAVALAAGEVTLTVPGFWGGLGLGTLLMYGLFCFLASLLVVLLLGSFFGPSPSYFRVAFSTAFLIGPLLVTVLVAFVSGGTISIEGLIYTYGFTWAYALTVLMVFPTLSRH
jgi:hypothetical protein